MKQTWENGNKPHLGPISGLFDPNLGPFKIHYYYYYYYYYHYYYYLLLLLLKLCKITLYFYDERENKQIKIKKNLKKYTYVVVYQSKLKRSFPHAME